MADKAGATSPRSVESEALLVEKEQPIDGHDAITPTPSDAATPSTSHRTTNGGATKQPETGPRRSSYAESEEEEMNLGLAVRQVDHQLVEKAEKLICVHPHNAQEKEERAESPESYPTYKRRWFVLVVVAILNGSNAMSWIAYAPVANHTDAYYTAGAANWLSLVFLMAAIPVAFVAMWSSGKFGLRSAILIAGFCNGLGATIRLISSLIPEYRFPVVLAGQVVAAVAYPFIMFLPTKVAAAWFPHDQRAIANTLATLSNPLGVLFANLISPQLVTAPEHILFLNIITFIPSISAFILALVVVRSSAPKRPPSRSAAQTSLPFLAGIKKVAKSRSFILLFFCLGGGIGMFNALYTVMQQLLCPKGYYNSFAGLCSALMIIGGTIGATASGIIVDRTKKYELTVKISFALAVICGCIFAQLVLHPNLKPAIAVLAFFFGVFGIAAYPIGLEIGAECTFPVAETTSTGLIVLGGQIEGSIFIILVTGLGRAMDPSESGYQHQVCTIVEEGAEAVVAKDMTWAMIAFSAIGVALAVSFVIFFRPKLRRFNLENQPKPMVAKANGSEPVQPYAAGDGAETVVRFRDLQVQDVRQINGMEEDHLEDQPVYKDTVISA